MLGKAFESLMEPGERHATGAYYTPQPLVERVTREALAHALASAEVSVASIAALLAGDDGGPVAQSAVRGRLARVRVLDPACGSGAFLVHALEVLAALAERVGDERPVSERRQAVLGRSIFGVDINPTAVWLCELRLWLSVVIETEESDPGRVVPLPNLDRNVRIGDALAGGAFGTGADGPATRVDALRAGRRIGRLRERYARARGGRKRVAVQQLEREVRARAIEAMEREIIRVAHARRDMLGVARSRDLFGAADPGRSAHRGRRVMLRTRARALRAQLAALRDGGALPFAFATHFADVDVDGGFDAVVGNPPWVRPHAVAVIDRERWRRDFVVARQAAWRRGAPLGDAGRGFGAQVDLAALFVERGVSLTREDGVVALLLPAKLWRSLAGGGVRRLIADQTTVLAIEDWSAARAVFDAAAYPSLVVLRRGSRRVDTGTTIDASSLQ
jgi:SAM-dependent methyltransferase